MSCVDVYKGRMRPLSPKYKLQSPSCPELTRGLRDYADVLRDEGFKHADRVLSHGPLLNAVVAWYLSQPESVREMIAQQGLDILDLILSKPYVRSSANSFGGASVVHHDGNAQKPVGKDKRKS